MNFSEIQINPDLPIASYEDEICSAFEANTNLIIIGETGSGKTTQIPIIILKILSQFQDLSKGKVVITEPRRLAATSVSEYISQYYFKEELGNTVGYKIRFDEKLSEESLILFMTDGIMLREAQLDPLLLKYSVIIVDEAHERNINSDFLIGLLVEVQKKRKEQGLIPLKIIVASATLEKEKFVNFFQTKTTESLATIEVPGRLFPIKTFYPTKSIFQYEYEAAQTAFNILTNSEKGDILIFMPGKREIDDTKKYLNELGLDIEVIVVHANLSIEQQNEIFKKTNKRKVVIATNIAETSLTVPGIVYVIDTGLIKQMEFDPHTGINSLVTKYHSRKGLEQRKGRAGRIENGYYYPLYTEASFRERKEHQTPEILRSSLTQVVLVMKRVGINDIESFSFIDAPNFHNLESAIRELIRYKALDKQENITEKGLLMAELPIEPRLSNLILEAQNNHCVDSICTISAFLELKPVIIYYTLEDFIRQITQESDLQGYYLPYEEIEKKALSEYHNYQKRVSALQHPYSDFFTLIEIFKRWQLNHENPEWAKINFLNAETLIEATNIKTELKKIVYQANIETNDQQGKDLNERIEKTVIKAFRYNSLVKSRNGLYQRIKSKDSDIRIHNSSVLAALKPEYLIAYEIIEINDIGSAPKLSAKFAHALREDTINKYFAEEKHRLKKLRSSNERFERSRPRRGKKERFRKGRR